MQSNPPPPARPIRHTSETGKPGGFDAPRCGEINRSTLFSRLRLRLDTAEIGKTGASAKRARESARKYRPSWVVIAILTRSRLSVSPRPQIHFSRVAHHVLCAQTDFFRFASRAFKITATTGRRRMRCRDARVPLFIGHCLVTSIDRHQRGGGELRERTCAILMKGNRAR